jgi:hypothetical protein
MLKKTEFRTCFSDLNKTHLIELSKNTKALKQNKKSG